MAVDLDDEILQDFLVEAGEILEQLNEQLVDLEHSPDDNDLLNSIFRGFHTIKGGASFLALDNLIQVCHQSEDVFNLLRNRELRLDAAMMDVFLQVLDTVNSMFAEIHSGIDPSAAETSLLQQLMQLQVSEVVGDATAKFIAGDDEISDDEFDSLLDALQGKPAGSLEDSEKAELKTSDQSSDTKFVSNNEISDDEFEALLDSLHGAGSAPKIVEKNKSDEKESVAVVKLEPAAKSAVRAQKPTQRESTVRVDTSRLDEIMNLVGELVLARNRLNTLKVTLEDEHVHAAISNLDVITGDLQAAVMKTRMQPVKKVFGRFPRVVRDMARSLKKEISLEMRGEETNLDKNLVEALADPLVHLVRNSVDHGVETPDVREAAGKSREGKVVLAAQQEGDHILLSITDDGAGMDPEVLRCKAIEKGLMDADRASRLDDKGCFDLIFMPGLSTKQEVTDISGRGVGMDVVKTRINQLNGSIDIDSKLGKGTVLKIKVPLTLVILPTLMVQLGSRKFALPLSNVSEIFELGSRKISVVGGREVVRNHGKAPQVFHLRKWLLDGSESTQADYETSQVIMVEVANTHVGLIVDHVIGQEEVVIKPLGAFLHGLPGMAGSTITGDGNIAIILDVQSLLEHYA